MALLTTLFTEPSSSSIAKSISTSYYKRNVSYRATMEFCIRIPNQTTCGGVLMLAVIASMSPMYFFNALPKSSPSASLMALTLVRKPGGHVTMHIVCINTQHPPRRIVGPVRTSMRCADPNNGDDHLPMRASAELPPASAGTKAPLAMNHSFSSHCWRYSQPLQRSYQSYFVVLIES